MTSTRIEFAVQMTCESCVKAVKNSLANNDDIKKVDVNLETGSVVVETALSTERVLQLLEKSGRKAAPRGYGTAAAVAIMEAGEPTVKGVVRFVQESSSRCVVDGTIDGLVPGSHRLSVHECGDISQGCESVGRCFTPFGYPDTISYGNLGTIEAASNGRATFRLDNGVIKLPDIIGRSLVVSDPDKRLACGIIARSAGLFQNPKTICACDGVNIWDEKVSPKAAL